MAGKALKQFICVALVLTLAFPAFAQQASNSPNGESSQGRGNVGPRRQLATIIFAGLGGAVLGLSTLSFYGRPQDKLSNIAIGFAVGVISGTVMVTYSAATNPSGFYGQAKPLLEREAELAQARFNTRPTPQTLGMNWTF